MKYSAFLHLTNNYIIVYIIFDNINVIVLFRGHLEQIKGITELHLFTYLLL